MTKQGQLSSEEHGRFDQPGTGDCGPAAAAWMLIISLPVTVGIGLGLFI